MSKVTVLLLRLNAVSAAILIARLRFPCLAASLQQDLDPTIADLTNALNPALLKYLFDIPRKPKHQRQQLSTRCTQLRNVQQQLEMLYIVDSWLMAPGSRAQVPFRQVLGDQHVVSRWCLVPVLGRMFHDSVRHGEIREVEYEWLLARTAVGDGRVWWFAEICKGGSEVEDTLNGLAAAHEVGGKVDHARSVAAGVVDLVVGSCALPDSLLVAWEFDDFLASLRVCEPLFDGEGSSLVWSVVEVFEDEDPDLDG